MEGTRQSSAASARQLLLGQLAAIERGGAPPPPPSLLLRDTVARSAAAAAAGPAATAARGRRSLPFGLHMALGMLLVAAAVGFSGGSIGVAPGNAVRLNVVSFARAEDGRLEVVAQEPAPASGQPLIAGAERVVRPGAPTWLSLPDLGIDSRVEGAGLVLHDGIPTWEILPDVVAHYDGSAVPGETGNVVMAGHLNTPLSQQGAVFRALPQARVGQRIQVFSGDTRYTYTIESVRIVDPSDTSVMAPTEDARLTLVTCYPDYDFSERLVVTASFTPGA